MTFQASVLLALYAAIVLLITRPLGAYMARVFEGERTFLHGALGWVESSTYRALGVSPEHDMKWTEYAISLLAFSLVSLSFTYAALRLQGFLPLNPQQLGAA